MENLEPKTNEPAKNETAEPKIKPGRPNDFGTVQIDAHFKIFDPNTQQIFVQGRA